MRVHTQGHTRASWEELLAAADACGQRLHVLVGDPRGTPLPRLLQGPTTGTVPVLLMGNEVRGPGALPPFVPHTRVAIPMAPGAVESLNVGAAAAVLLHTLAAWR